MTLAINHSNLFYRPSKGGYQENDKVMKKDLKQQAIKRMSFLIGHLQANKLMVENDRYCIDIICQNNAVIAALKKVNDLILSSHLDTCATTAIKDGSIQKRQKILKELLEIYKAN